MVPRQPAQLSKYAIASLRALADKGLGRALSLGGALGLMHYLDYRSTHDVDAWWSPDVTAEERQRVLAAVEEALTAFGDVKRRSWGEVVSLDLRVGKDTAFSFQIASRSAQLEPSTPAPWVDILLDSLPDLVAGKMVALVERGAPRDFRDIHALCRAHVTSASECWDLWRRRQELAGSDTDRSRARLAVETHLERIARHRPLEGIDDPARREEAEDVRRWFNQEFLDALRD